jgi:hypothetical protein
VQRAFQDDEMLILVLVDMHWYTVGRIRDHSSIVKLPSVSLTEVASC